MLRQTVLPYGYRSVLCEPLESRRLLAFAVTFPTGGTLAPRTDVNISPHVPPNLPGNPGNEAETQVVVNPTNPQNVVVFPLDVNEVGSLEPPLKAWYSFDGGLTYASSNIPDPEGHTPAMDPSAAFDRAGNLYFTHFTRTFSPDMYHLTRCQIQKRRSKLGLD